MPVHNMRKDHAMPLRAARVPLRGQCHAISTGNLMKINASAANGF